MEFDLSHATHVLERTPATFRAMLAGLPEAWTTPNEGGDSFSAFDNVAHVVHGERDDWIQTMVAAGLGLGFANTGIDYWTHARYGVPSMFRGNQLIKEEGHATDLFKQEALKFIEARRSKQPVFATIWFSVAGCMWSPWVSVITIRSGLGRAR